MQQIIVDFGAVEVLGFEIHLRIFGYGLAMVLGFLLGIYLAQRRARRAGENSEHISYCGMLALVGGIVGARTAWVIEQFVKHPDAAPRTLADMIDITSGGLIYYGGVALATAMILAFLFVKRLPVRRFLDIVAPSLMIGLAFGRLGCLLNGCCYGGPAKPDWPLAMRFPMYSRPLIKLDGRSNPYSSGAVSPSPAFAQQMEIDPKTGRALLVPDPALLDGQRLVSPKDYTAEQIALAEAARSLPVKPAQPLGIANALILAGLLLAFGRIRRTEGQVFALLVILYPITRFLEEIVRADNHHNVAHGILTHNQYTSIILVVVGVVFWLALRRLPASAGPTLAQRTAAGGPVRGQPRQPHDKRPRKELT